MAFLVAAKAFASLLVSSLIDQSFVIDGDMVENLLAQILSTVSPIVKNR